MLRAARGGWKRDAGSARTRSEGSHARRGRSCGREAGQCTAKKTRKDGRRDQTEFNCTSSSVLFVRLPSERARGAQGGVPHRCAGNGPTPPGLRRPHSRGRAESGRRGPGRCRPLFQDLAFWPRVKRAVVHGHSCRPAVRCCQPAAYSTVQYSTVQQRTVIFILDLSPSLIFF